MERPDVGVQNLQPASTFSLAYTNASKPWVRLKIYTDRAVAVPNVLFGGVAMTAVRSGRHSDPAWTEHIYEILNPPIGTQVITGTFAEDVLYVARLDDDGPT